MGSNFDDVPIDVDSNGEEIVEVDSRQAQRPTTAQTGSYKPHAAVEMASNYEDSVPIDVNSNGDDVAKVNSEEANRPTTIRVGTYKPQATVGGVEDCENGVALEASAEKKQKKKPKKKRKEPEPDASVTEDIAYGKEEDADGTQSDDNEPTMADKLASLNLGKNDDIEIQERQGPLAAQPPSADSVHVLLKQALHADDRALLLDCLYNQDDKVIANSVSLLNPADIFRLLDSLMSIVQSRGAVLVCALPWLRTLLLQHSSRIMSQESSLVALNSLYQLIESRVATFNSTMRLASSLDILFAGVDDDGLDEYESAPPVIYEDNGESDQEESGEDDAMETDEETKEPEEFSGLSDIDGSEGFSD